MNNLEIINNTSVYDCPKCGARLDVYDSRKRFAGHIHRAKRCSSLTSDCDYKIATVEIEREDYKKLLALKNIVSNGFNYLQTIFTDVVAINQELESSNTNNPPEEKVA